MICDMLWSKITGLIDGLDGEVVGEDQVSEGPLMEREVEIQKEYQLLS